MRIQLIRNATMKLTYAGRTILTDPMLSPKDELDSFAGIARNPTIGLPFEIEEIVKKIDSVVVSHDHPDHFDPAASRVIPKDIPVFCQPEDATRITEEGFKTVLPIETSQEWEGITLTRTGGRHGSGKILERMGNVSGFLFRASGEPTVYWVGDSIWCDEVEDIINEFDPDVILTHSGGATIPGHDPIIMDANQTLNTIHASPDAVVVAIHLEALDHCPVTREALRRMAENESIPQSRLLIPKDGETIFF